MSDHKLLQRIDELEALIKRQHNQFSLVLTQLTDTLSILINPETKQDVVSDVYYTRHADKKATELVCLRYIKKGEWITVRSHKEMNASVKDALIGMVYNGTARLADQDGLKPGERYFVYGRDVRGVHSEVLHHIKTNPNASSNDKVPSGETS